MLKIYDCKTEYRNNPIGIDAAAPRFSWKIQSDRQNVIQTSYRIIAHSGNTLLWDSGSVLSSESQRIPYGGPTLTSGQQVYWTVEVSAGGVTAVSESAFFEMGLLSPDCWKAAWIEPEGDIDYDLYKPAPLLRKVFPVKSGLVRARIYQSAHGLYEFWINGVRGTGDRFNPGFTSYHYRVQYQAYDILPLLQEGENVWAVQLGDGWWRGNTGGGNRNNFGFKLHFIGQIVLDYADGSQEVVITDPGFKTSFGGLLSSDMKNGDVYDARLEPNEWKLPDFDDSQWNQVHLAQKFNNLDALIPSRSVPVTEHETFDAKVFLDASGNLVLDFGQNIAGYVRMTVRGCRPGQKITLLHGEGLKNGVFSTDNIELPFDDPFQQVDYICNGDSEESYCPNFSVFGFRYVKVEGYEGTILPGDFVAVAVYSDLEETGSFRCSNPLVNQLVNNSLWSQKGNFLDVATDCPTRERSAWSGDGQVYCKTASDFMCVYPFFEKWMYDLTLEQFESGCVGNTFPSTNTLHNPEEQKRMIEQGRFIFTPPTLAGPKGNGELLDGAAGWGDVATIVPYTMYLCYGDKQILNQQYESAKRWSLYQRNATKNHNPLYEDHPEYHTFTDGILDADFIFDTKYHWGEWLEPDAVENGGPTSFNPPEIAKRGNPLVATAYLYYSSILVSKMAEVLGKNEDAQDFLAYAKNVKRVYNKYFIQRDGTILEGRQAPYARTLAFGLADKENEPLVAEKLAQAVRDNGYKLNTGFLSTPFVLQQLCRYGYVDCAFRLLEQTENPSWLHPITLGATTILESWSGMDNFSNSFNHYSYGAVCDFLFSWVAGIQPVWATPGYRHFILRPTWGGSLSYAEASFDSPYGVIRSAWTLVDGTVRYQCKIPANTTASVVLPNDFKLTAADMAKYSPKSQDGVIMIHLGSGSYTFG